MSGEVFFIGSVTCFFMGALVAVIMKENSRINNLFSHLFALAGSLAAAASACVVYATGQGWEIGLPFSVWQEEAMFRLDHLGAFFLFMTGVGGAAVSLYAIGYCRSYMRRRLWLLTGLYNVFLLSLVLVFSAQHALLFLLAWEVMALSSCLLVNHEYEEAGVSQAAYLYFAMTQAGTAFIVMAFFSLAAASGSMDFSLLNGAFLTEGERNFVFLCALIGFGAKGGLMPLHIWLPRAHPAAPSHISALMSGVMLKTAVYGMLRMSLQFLPSGPLWWGELMVAVGLISLLLGILYAFLEKDLKRLLAYSSVENVGLIFFTIGVGLLFSSKGDWAAAQFAWTAALCHALNHSLFKTLAFLGVGAVYQATHSKDADQLGGLIKKMPYTAVFFLISVMALAALPPLNGFWGEWLIFQAVLQLGPVLGGMVGKLISALLIAGLGMAGVFAAACFVEAFGISFLAKARSKGADEAKEVALTMRAGQGVLALCCVGAAVFPQFVIQNAAAALPAGVLVWSGDMSLFSAALPNGYSIDSRWLIASLFAGLVLSLGLARLGGKEKQTPGETWTCGIVPDRQMEYTASGFSQAAKRAFRRVVHPHEEQLINQSPHRYHGQKLSYEIRLHYLFSTQIYEPLQRRLVEAAQIMKQIQGGSVQVYVGYIFVVTIAVLLWSAR